MRRAFREHTGLTMVELLCVVAIIVIMTAVAMPLVAGIKQRGKLDTAAWALAADMRLAQQVAITGRKTTRIEFREEARDYRIFLPGDPAPVKLPDGIAYGGINFPKVQGVHRLSFSMTGAPNQGGTVILKDTRGDRRYVIVTPATGRVRVSKDPPDHW